MLVGCVGINSSSTTIVLSSPVGMSEAWDVGGKRQEVADQLLTAAGATGSRTWWISSGREWVVGGRPPARPRRPSANAKPDPTPSPSPSGTTGATPRFDHIFVVVEENHGYSQIIGSPNAPY